MVGRGGQPRTRRRPFAGRIGIGACMIDSAKVPFFLGEIPGFTLSEARLYRDLAMIHGPRGADYQRRTREPGSKQSPRTEKRERS